jgi:glutamine synthetase
LSFAALRRADPFASGLMAALAQAGVEPEVLIAEFGLDQFEVTCAPASPVAAADRCIAIREITRELARLSGWHASFSPKTAPEAVGNGVHIHFSLVDAQGKPATYDPAGPAGLSTAAGAFCAGVVRHLPALTALTAPSVASYLRLKPHSWSASYTWLGDRDREASLRICPFTTIEGSDPARQFNIEYRAADATGNPYLGLAAILFAGLAGIEGQCSPIVASGDPSAMDDDERASLGLVRLPETLDQALVALRADRLLMDRLPAALVDCFEAVKRVEIARFADAGPDLVCREYSRLY